DPSVESDYETLLNRLKELTGEEQLHLIGDLERIISKVAVGRVSPREVGGSLLFYIDSLHLK
ncbi:hypothetical protein, partial [Bacteroides sp. 224]|uniref:hypothetical protein n=1 Tax=Bacteroides sp. 224 TaxID=2302936 RepID=UPI0013D55B5E